MIKKPIYLDYMATTPIDPRVIEQMLHYMGPESHFGNPSSTTHVYGQMAARAIDTARAQVAAVIHAREEEIVFTSGATESNNLAILGAARFYQRKGRHVITMSTEHKAVLDSFKQLERDGFSVTYLDPEASGLLNLSALSNALREDTVLVSIMHVNNEIGVIQDISAIGQLLRGKGIIFHVDAAQSMGKLPIDLQTLAVDLMSFSAHKNYGPKGVGALFVRHKPRIRIQPQTFGGGHEGGLRSGTLATHQIVGLGAACHLSESIRVVEQARLFTLRQRLWDGICHLPGMHLNGDANQRIAGNLNFSISKLAGEELLTALSELAISTVSACVSASLQPSYVLKAMGLPPEIASNSLRLSVGRYTQDEEIATAIRVICEQVSRLQNK